MLTNVISIAMLIGGVACLLFGSSFGLEANPAFYLKTLLAVIGGGGVTLYNNVGVLKSVASFATKATPKQASKIFLPEDYEVKDFEAITHLRDRCVDANSVEGLKACAELAAILFQLDTPKAKV